MLKQGFHEDGLQIQENILNYLMYDLANIPSSHFDRFCSFR